MPTPTPFLILPDSSLTDQQVEAAIEVHWATRAEATSALIENIAIRLMRITQTYLPAAHTIVLREDNSHLPAHGHVDDILDVAGVSIMPDHETWHDLAWTHLIDDEVWDIYYLDSLRFVREDDTVRRFRIQAS